MSDDVLNIFLEFVPGGSIRQLLERFGSFEEPVGGRTRPLFLLAGIVCAWGVVWYPA
jgi:hypothetical protein